MLNSFILGLDMKLAISNSWEQASKWHAHRYDSRPFTTLLECHNYIMQVHNITKSHQIGHFDQS